MRTLLRAFVPVVLVLAGVFDPSVASAADSGAAAACWPEVTNTMKPWAYNWWPGSAVDRQNLSHELARYQAAGLGGIHIIPVYGARARKIATSPISARAGWRCSTTRYRRPASSAWTLT